MSVVLQFLAFFTLGAGFSLAFFFLKKVKLGKITRFAVDFILSASLCLAFYALNFVFNYGELVQYSFLGIGIGFITPRIFL